MNLFNVISLFNANIPLIALKMTAIENPNGTLGLMFTKILDVATPALDEEDSTVEQTDRQYWEKNSSKEVLKTADGVLGLVREFEPKAVFSYNKFYLGIWVDGRPNNFVVFRLRRRYFLVDIKLEHTAELDELIEQSVFEEVNYRSREGRYRFRVDSQTSEEGLNFLEKLLQKAYRRVSGFLCRRVILSLLHIGARTWRADANPKIPPMPSLSRWSKKVA